MLLYCVYRLQQHVKGKRMQAKNKEHGIKLPDPSFDNSALSRRKKGLDVADMVKVKEDVTVMTTDEQPTTFLGSPSGSILQSCSMQDLIVRTLHFISHNERKRGQTLHMQIKQPCTLQAVLLVLEVSLRHEYGCVMMLVLYDGIQRMLICSNEACRECQHMQMCHL